MAAVSWADARCGPRASLSRPRALAPSRPSTRAAAAAPYRLAACLSRTDDDSGFASKSHLPPSCRRGCAALPIACHPSGASFSSSTLVDSRNLLTML
jgi:hypothetical protein